MSRRASAATSTSYARDDRATSMSPLVSRSRRCTMPGRAGPPTSESSGNRPSNPFPSGPPGCPAPGWTTSPPGFPAPPTSSPAKRACTGHGPYRDRRVGDVERGERSHADEVDDLAAQESRRAEQPIDEVAQRAAEHERERDDHDRVSRALGDADEHDGDDGREYGEQRREPGQDAERAPGIAAQPKLDGIADDRKRPVGEGRDDPRLRDLVEQDDRSEEHTSE